MVGGCALFDLHYYEDTHPDFCVTSVDSLLQHILFLVTPCGLVLIANILIFLRVAQVLLQRRKPPGYRLGAAKPHTVTWAQVGSR